ncbi:MAG: hypothetical protein JKY70_17390 [Mucilaginibacter sp.]|nr:hypothetical protein [Mucilaginibacter sp.]
MSIRFHELTYSLKIWLTTLLFVPVVFLVMMSEFYESPSIANIVDRLSEWLLAYLLMVLFAAVFSFLIWVIFYYLLMMIVWRVDNICILKYISAAIGLMLIIGIVALLSMLVYDITILLDKIFITLFSSTCFSIVCSALFYKLYTVTEAEEQIAN